MCDLKISTPADLNLGTSFASTSALSMYEIGKHIGSGFQGSVYHATRKCDGHKLIVKEMLANDELNRDRAL